MKNATFKNYQIILIPEDDNLQGTKNVLFQIQKHIEGFSDFHICCEAFCDFCGLRWDEEWIDGGKPQCCQKATDEWQKEEDETNLNEIQG